MLVNGGVMLVNGDAARLPLADGSVHCAVTSTPYWGLRDYGLDERGLGLEPTPDQYVANMVSVFREVWRVLRDDGTVWLNLGDSYAGSGKGQNPDGTHASKHGEKQHTNKGTLSGGLPTDYNGLKPKDLCGIPWRVAFALQADGWYLRSDIIWHKPNPMPESVTDRPTKSHEYVFLLSKKPRYFYDADAVREIYTKPLDRWGGDELVANGESSWDEGTGQERYRNRNMRPNPAGRNRRTVWTIATKPYSGAHFATYPPALVEPCIKAGTSERGCCPVCGKQWVRVVEKIGKFQRRWSTSNADGSPYNKQDSYQNIYESTGFRPDCEHYDGDYLRDMPQARKARKRYQRWVSGDWWERVKRTSVPYPWPTKESVVLDPFAGSGTTLQVARSLGRRGVGVDLSLEYLHLARSRLELDRLDEWREGKKDGKGDLTELPMFAGMDKILNGGER